jgi:Family of unknown function (DUF6502)
VTRRSELLDACLRLLRPLARILLRHGLSTYDFTRIANIAFVRAARDILSEQGKPVSFSRISAITGLHRHVVSDIVNSPETVSPDPAFDKDYRRNRLARVLSGWFESPRYTDGEGRPLILETDGAEPSFASLVRTFSGDIYPRIILDELLEVGAAKMLKDGKVKAVARRYSSGGAEPAAIQHLGSTARDVFNTLEYNLATAPDARGAAFLEDVEGWVLEHERPDAPDSVRAGVIVQMFVNASTETGDEPVGPRTV